MGEGGVPMHCMEWSQMLKLLDTKAVMREEMETVNESHYIAD